MLRRPLLPTMPVLFAGSHADRSNGAGREKHRDEYDRGGGVKATTSDVRHIRKHLRPSGDRQTWEITYYNLLIKALIDLGWNAVFKVEKLSDYGNPRKRRRLIIIASW